MNKILVANRGEIALRVMRTCKEMGIKTVAIFSEADRNAPFVQFADQSVCIGPPPSNESYLKIDEIIELAKELNVDGIHPGYGFLSENPEFVNAVEKAGLTFIGPSAEAMKVMGSKLAAKAAVKKYDIPLVPGTDEAVDDIEEAKKIAGEIGFPILIKASAGGGGKGMRIVEDENEFESQLKMAVSEAESSFGDGSVFIERYVKGPRHIEIQVLADKHGNYRHLFERECSIQRRHQKVIEEAPSAVLTDAKREEMGQCAIDVAKSCDYVGAGTVEFLYDANNNFYFLEMNTRLQVEHPVTELITGVDLVREQINIARDEKVSFEQDELSIHGHALEARVYAEDPMNNFLPDIGKLLTYRSPEGPGIRVDDGFVEGMEIPIYYDPMISKLSVHARTRDEAIDRLVRAIDEYRISGVTTTMEFCKYAVQHEAFRSGNFDTHFVKEHWNPEEFEQQSEPAIEKVAAIFGTRAAIENRRKSTVTAENDDPSVSKWKTNRLRK